MNKFAFSLSVLSAVSLSSAAIASDEENGNSHGDGHPANVVGVFLGATDGSETDFTFGVEYERRVSTLIGLGTVLEHTPGGHGGDGITVALAALHLHPAGGLRLTGGIGVEFVHGAHSAQEFLFRLGAAYDIEMGGGFAFAPTVNVDFVDGHEVVVFGGVLMRHF